MKSLARVPAYAGRPTVPLALLSIGALMALAPPARADGEASAASGPAWLPAFLHRVFLGNELWQWLVALVVLLGTVLVLKIAVRVAASRLSAMDEATRAGIKDLPLELVSMTTLFFYVVLGVWLGSRVLDMPPSLRRVFDVAATAGVFIQVGIWGAHTIREILLNLLKRRAQVKGETVFANLVSTLVNLVVWIFVVLVGLANMGVNVSALVAGVGISSIAVALAVQNILGDLFASLVIATDKPFQVGDYIVVGDFMGTVKRIGLKTTRLKSLSGEQLVFSNADLLSSRIRNYKRMKDRRASFSFGVEYGTPAEQLEAIPGWVEEAIASQPKTRFDRAHFTEFGDSALQFDVVFYMTVPDYAAYRAVQQHVNLALYRKLEEEGVEFAFPTRTLHVSTQEAGAKPQPKPRSEPQAKSGRPSRQKSETAPRSKAKAQPTRKATRRKTTRKKA